MRLMASDCTSGELATLPSFGFQFAQVDAAEHTKLKVRVELEVERRLRIQSALDNAEKRCYASNRLLEKKVRCPTAKQILMHNNHTWLGLINKLTVWGARGQGIGVGGRTREPRIAAEQERGRQRAAGEDDQGEGGQNSGKREGGEGPHVESGGVRGYVHR